MVYNIEKHDEMRAGAKRFLDLYGTLHWKADLPVLKETSPHPHKAPAEFQLRKDIAHYAFCSPGVCASWQQLDDYSYQISLRGVLGSGH